MKRLPAEFDGENDENKPFKTMSIRTPAVHSVMPFIGALLWRQLTCGQVMNFTVASFIQKKTEPQYSQILRIASLPGGSIAAFALDLAKRLEEEDEKANLAVPDNGVAVRNRARHRRAVIQEQIVEDTRAAFPESRRQFRGLDLEQIEDLARTGWPLAISRVIRMYGMQPPINTEKKIRRAFWKFARATFSEFNNGIRTKPPSDTLWGYQVAKCTYETRELIHPVQLNTPKETADAHGKIIAYYHEVAGRARAAIDTWTIIAWRVGIVRDIRDLLARALWEERHVWAAQKKIEREIARKRAKVAVVTVARAESTAPEAPAGAAAETTTTTTIN